MSFTVACLAWLDTRQDKTISKTNNKPYIGRYGCGPHAWPRTLPTRPSSVLSVSSCLYISASQHWSAPDSRSTGQAHRGSSTPRRRQASAACARCCSPSSVIQGSCRLLTAARKQVSCRLLHVLYYTFCGFSSRSLQHMGFVMSVRCTPLWHLDDTDVPVCTPRCQD